MDDFEVFPFLPAGCIPHLLSTLIQSPFLPLANPAQKSSIEWILEISSYVKCTPGKKNKNKTDDTFQTQKRNKSSSMAFFPGILPTVLWGVHGTIVPSLEARTST